MPPKFVVRKGSTGKYRFNLVASNGQVIATSEAYETKARALAGVESVRKNAAGATLVDDTAPVATKATAAKPAKAAKAAKPAARSAAKAVGKAVGKAAAPARKAATKAARPAKKAASKATS